MTTDDPSGPPVADVSDDLAAGEAAPGEAVRSRYEIRILSDGRVVFGDLPQGLLEVARVVAGSDPQPQAVATESE